ncbi:uncharacterized [Tachysurus ichikawai]
MSVAVTPDFLQLEPNTRFKIAGSLFHSLQSDRQSDVAFNMADSVMHRSLPVLGKSRLVSCDGEHTVVSEIHSLLDQLDICASLCSSSDLNSRKACPQQVPSFFS